MTTSTISRATPLFTSGTAGEFILFTGHSVRRGNRAVKRSGEAELAQKCRHVVVGPHRYSAAIGVDLPHVGAGNIERLTSRRNAGRKPFAGVSAGHSPFVCYAAGLHIHKRFADRHEREVGES